MDQLMRKARSVFNLHPDAEFNSLSEILHVAGKYYKYDNNYVFACSLLASDMALYIDKQNLTNKGDN